MIAFYRIFHRLGYGPASGGAEAVPLDEAPAGIVDPPEERPGCSIMAAHGFR
jgi:hypothetical protein